MSFFKKTKTVLIVEDDENTGQLLEFYARWAGYKTVLARDGKTALELVRKSRPDLVVLDIMLPEMHGLEVCHRLKLAPGTKDLPVLMTSVKNFPADRRQAQEAGADVFMAKPLEEKVFIETVGRLLGEKR